LDGITIPENRATKTANGRRLEAADHQKKARKKAAKMIQ